MKVTGYIWIVLWVCCAGRLVAAPEEKQSTPDVAEVIDEGSPEYVLSRSRQFRVSGTDRVVRGAAAMLAERAKDSFLQLLGEEDTWKVPVIIVLHGEVGNDPPKRSIATRLWLVGEVWQFQIDKHMGPGMESDMFRRTVTELLVMERCLKAKGLEVSEQPMRVPVWLSVGLMEASAWRYQESDRQMYAALFRRGGLFALDALFELDASGYAGLDGATREAFRVSAGSLVMALLEQPNGIEGFRGFLGEVAVYQGEVPILLREYFPGLNLSENSLSKWWALQLANKGDIDLLSDVMSIAETNRALEQVLFLEVINKGGVRERVGLDEWERLEGLQPSERQAAVRASQTALTHLSYRCFPSSRPLLIEYQKLLVRISVGQTETVERSLMRLDGARRLLIERAERGRDYLDWFEISRARETSGAFDDYLRLKEELKERKRTRNDEISEYLDRMEEIFDRHEE